MIAVMGMGMKQGPHEKTRQTLAPDVHWHKGGGSDETSLAGDTALEVDSPHLPHCCSLSRTG